MKFKVILLFLISQCILYGQPKTLKSYGGYSGRPKMVELTNFQIAVNKKGESNITEKLMVVYQYDKRGKLINEKIFNGETIYEEVKYVYRKERGVTFLKSIRVHNGDTRIFVEKYNRKKQLIYLETPKVKKHYEYNKKEMTAEVKSYYTTGEFHDRSIYSFDNNGRNIKIQSFDKKNDQRYLREQEEDDEGNEIVSSWYQGKNIEKELIKTTYKNHKHPTLQRKFQIKEGDTLPKAILKWNYDTFNNITKEELIVNDISYITLLKYTY